MFRRANKGIDPNDKDRDFKLLESIVVDAFAEQKKARKWGIVFKTLTFAYLFVVLILFYSSISGANKEGGATKPHTAIVQIRGPIAADSDASAGRINASLRKAFKNEHSKAIILAINSPGGSPVQSGYVYDEIFRLKAEYPNKKVYAVVEDIGASGAYYIAAAADEIYANRSSLVGSIGVIAPGFGFVDLIEKIGVERRVFSSGESKAFLDPFLPVNEDQKKFWQEVLVDVHQQFITAVKNGRGDRLKEDERVFSGLIFNGEQAKEIGLIDGLGSARHVARQIVGQDKLVNYTYRKNPIEDLLGKLGVAVGEGIADKLTTQQAVSPLQ